MTADDLCDLILASLVRAHGGSKSAWRRALGPLSVRDVRTHPHCNWSASPSGTTAEVSAIEALLDDVRMAHPIVHG